MVVAACRVDVLYATGCTCLYRVAIVYIGLHLSTAAFAGVVPTLGACLWVAFVRPGAGAPPSVSAVSAVPGLHLSMVVSAVPGLHLSMVVCVPMVVVCTYHICVLVYAKKGSRNSGSPGKKCAIAGVHGQSKPKPNRRPGVILRTCRIGVRVCVRQACFAYMDNWGSSVCRPGVFFVQAAPEPRAYGGGRIGV